MRRGVIDLDGNRLLDLTGSYGVNLFGYEFYTRTIAEGRRSPPIWDRC